MSSTTLAPSSSIESTVKPGGRSKTVATMMLANRWATIYAAAFLPIIVSAVLVLFTFAWMKANHWTPNVFYDFFKSSLVMPAIVILVLAVGMYSFIVGNLKLVMGMGFTRRDIWWAVLKVAALNALISTLVISIFCVIELLTQGYGVNWYVFSMDLDEHRFYLHGLGYGPASAAVEFARFASHYFLIILAAQLAAAFLAVLRLRWGLLLTSITFLAIVFTALSFFSLAFGTISWDLGLSRLLSPYYQMCTENDCTLTLATGPWPLEEFQKIIDEGRTMEFSAGYMAKLVAETIAQILAFAAVLYAAGAAVLKKTDLR